MKSTLLGFLLLAGLSACLAQQQAAPHPLSNLPGPGEITTGFFFPEHAAKRFPAGQTIKAVLGLRNDASELYNITAILGSINMPADFKLYVQNFTEQVYHQPVQAGDELSIEYRFTPDARLPTLGVDQFQVALTVLYHDAAGKYFANTFFNQTVTVVEIKKLIDWELVFLFLILGGLLAGGVYLAYVLAAPQLQSLGFVKKSKKAKKVEAPSADSQDEWLKGTNYDTFQKRKAAAAAKKSAE